MGHDLTELAEELWPTILLIPSGFSTTRSRRRRRKMFVAAEPLESRTLLSAVSVAFDGVGALGLDLVSHAVSPVSALVDTSEFSGPDVSHVDQHAEESDQAQKSADVGSGFLFDSALGLEFSQAPLAGLGLAASGLASIPTSAARVASGFVFNSDAERKSESSDLAESGHVVELKLAGSGQVVAYGAARSVQDDSGLTVGGSDGPTTYVRSTDAEGRAVMRLVVVQRGPRSVALAESSRVISESVVVAEADLDSTALPAELTERADLNDLSTALDASHQDNSISKSHRHESALIAESDRAGLRTQPLQSTAKKTVVRTTMLRADHSANADIHSAIGDHVSATESADGDNGVVAVLEVSELAAAVFHPQPKYLVLAMLIIGSLARPFSRIRRSSIIRRLCRSDNL